MFRFIRKRHDQELRKFAIMNANFYADNAAERFAMAKKIYEFVSSDEQPIRRGRLSRRVKFFGLNSNCLR